MRRTVNAFVLACVLGLAACVVTSHGINPQPVPNQPDTFRFRIFPAAVLMEATFADNPTWYLRRFVTVHPIGGCPMGRSEADGVVNEFGEVFNYPGFYITDGSVVPGPVGPNPSLTIAAIANRCAESILDNLKK